MSARKPTMATGAIAGHRTQFMPPHREANDTPVTFEVTMTVPMSIEDIVATLWVLIEDGYTLGDLRNPIGPLHTPQALVLETLFADCTRIQETLCTVAEIRPGTPDHGLLSQLRTLVAEQFPAPAPAACPAPRPARRRRTRALAGVSA